jgi:dihydrofolate reductase
MLAAGASRRQPRNRVGADDFGKMSKSDPEKAHDTAQGEAVRALVVTQNVTVDGSIEMLESWFDPQGQGDQSDLLEEIHRQDRRSDAFLTGRRTFEDLRNYWPKQTDDTSGITDYLNTVRKYVVSSTLTDAQWENTTVLSGDPVQQVQALKEQQGLDIVITGSITLCHTLINAGLVDEYRMFVYPVVQGRGRRLFPDGFVLRRLKLLETQGFRSGVTYSQYRID